MDIFVVKSLPSLSNFLHDTYFKRNDCLLGINTCAKVTTIHLQTYC
jgi:hypothetical protein